jgi:hypothetical protein
LNLIQQSAPDLTEWRRCDHSAAVTRTYAIYERFVEDLIRAWLEELPRLVERYDDLDDNLRKNHRLGIGRLLTALDRRRFRKLTPHAVITGLYDGLTGAATYRLIPEAFLNSERNYHTDILAQTFASVGIDGILDWVSGHRFVTDFIRNHRDGTASLDSELRSFIGDRNEAAHGYIDEIMSAKLLRELVEFIRTLCAALREAVTAEVLRHLEKRGEAVNCGEITEHFKKAEAVVAVVHTGDLRVGDSLILSGKNLCRTAEVLSIQLDGIDTQEALVNAPTEIGLKLGSDVRTNLRIFVVKSPVGQVIRPGSETVEDQSLVDRAPPNPSD